jgi:hypothetical protein
MKEKFVEKVEKSVREDTIKGRCSILAEIINSIKNIYRNSNKNQKAFIETIIGAAIWYIPKPKNYWTGKISVGALNNLILNDKSKARLSEEHIIPRKYAAKELLENNNLLTDEFVEKEYTEKYCKVHFITSEENKRAIIFQKEFVNSEEIYLKANIKLIEIDTNILKQLRNGNIEYAKELINTSKSSHNST